MATLIKHTFRLGWVYTNQPTVTATLSQSGDCPCVIPAHVPRRQSVAEPFGNDGAPGGECSVTECLCSDPEIAGDRRT